ncbi:hypothetical protein LY474_22480 [Myxococcus stipitatus]|uniref:hypothetical protein n=1 Tax=Myxococcus stipitatus TaxID=83455 RepID=UPI001F29C484|nr:hypothetical protein [Myxococcus stipitatus]MCE9670576.1 hypothetical protein [Myxococcus stipitatus]
MAEAPVSFLERLEHRAARLLLGLPHAGPPVTHRRFEGWIHAFANMTGLSGACRDAMVEVATSPRRMLDEGAADVARKGANG